MREAEFQNLLMVALSRAGLRVWRQPSGQILTNKGTAVKAAPVGAADITGVVPGLGVRLEIECKGPKTRVTAEQEAWLTAARGWGCVALLVRARADETAHEAAERCCAEVLAAVEARR
jgi:hypothetical protein